MYIVIYVLTIVYSAVKKYGGQRTENIFQIEHICSQVLLKAQQGGGNAIGILLPAWPSIDEKAITNLSFTHILV